jgi:hypothetical protein
MGLGHFWRLSGLRCLAGRGVACRGIVPYYKQFNPFSTQKFPCVGKIGGPAWSESVHLVVDFSENCLAVRLLPKASLQTPLDG